MVLKTSGHDDQRLDERVEPQHQDHVINARRPLPGAENFGLLTLPELVGSRAWGIPSSAP
jgi:hypothetical protein